MNSKAIEKAAMILSTLYNVAKAEENGSAEHVGEYFSSKEIKRVVDELGDCIPSNLYNSEISEAVKDFVSENDNKTLEELLKISEDWLKNRDLNKAAKSKFYKCLLEKFLIILKE